MIGFQTLNNSKPRTALLVHGLFTTSGYWLSYLGSLRQYRLIILDIDYRYIYDSSPYVQRVLDIIQAEAGGHVDAVIAHSLGSLIANQLPRESRASSFEVCPVYCATRLNPDEFVGEIQRKAKFALQEGEIRALLLDVDGAISKYAICAQYLPDTAIYLPDADPYFSYISGQADKIFRGDHFDITEALKDIGKVLAS